MRKISVGNTLWLAVGILTGMACAFVVGFNPVLVTVDKEAGQIWPAWVQAFGSIAAILAAAAIAWWQRHSESRHRAADDLAKARSMAAFLYKDFARWRQKTGQIAKIPSMFGLDNHAIPQNIYEHLRDLHVTGPASAAATKAIGASLKAREVGASGTDGVKRFMRTDEQLAEYNVVLKTINESCTEVLAAFDVLVSIKSPLK